MSVLCEAISVIVTRNALDVAYPGGLRGYERDCPNSTFCADEHLTRVGFMHPDDVEEFLESLQRRSGLTVMEAGRFIDIAVVDQMTGPTRVCEWLDFTSSGGVTRAWLAGETPGELVPPAGWRPADLRLTTWEEAEGLPISEGRDGMQVTIDAATGDVRYLGRTGSGPAGVDRWHREQLLARRGENNLAGAYEAAEAWVENCPQAANAWYELGNSAIAANHPRRAVDAFRRALEFDPSFHEAAVNLGSALAEGGRAHEAIPVLTRAIDSGPPDPLAWFALANAHRIANDRAHEIVALRKCCEVAIAAGDRVWSEHARRRLADIQLKSRRSADATGSESGRHCDCGQAASKSCMECHQPLCRAHTTHRGTREVCFDCYDKLDPARLREQAAQRAAEEEERERQARMVDPVIGRRLASPHGTKAKFARSRRIGRSQFWRGPARSMTADEVPLSYSHFEHIGHLSLAAVFLTDRALYLVDVDQRGRHLPGCMRIPLHDILLAGPVTPGSAGEWALAVDVPGARPDKGQPPVEPHLFRPRQARSALTVAGWLMEDLAALLGDTRFRCVQLPDAHYTFRQSALQRAAAPESSRRREQLEIAWAVTREWRDSIESSRE